MARIFKSPSLLLLFVLTSPVALSLSSTVCLQHLGCYQDVHLHLDHASTYHSLDTKRTAENCARLCLQRRPKTEVVLVKLVDVNELLFCGCGRYQALGNHTGMTFDHLACYLCPDSLTDKCGSEKTSSVYEIIRYSEEPCRTVMNLPPPVTTTTDATTTTTTTTDDDTTTTADDIPTLQPPLEPFLTSVTTSNTSFNAPPPSPLNTTALPQLRHLGCYDEDELNQTLVVTSVVEYTGDGYEGVRYCAGNCSATHPTSKVYLLKVLSGGSLYCGCGLPAALPSTGGGYSGQCDMACGEGVTAVPCGGWTAVNAYERNSGTALVSSRCLSAVSVLLLIPVILYRCL